MRLCSDLEGAGRNGKRLAICTDLLVAELRRLACREPDRAAAARMGAIANALAGMARAEAARLAGMERQALRDAVVHHNAQGLPGLHDRPQHGPAPRLSQQQRALRERVLDGPDVEATGLSACTLAAWTLAAWILAGLCRDVEACATTKRACPNWSAGAACCARQHGRRTRRRTRRPGGVVKKRLQSAPDQAHAAYPGKRLTLWFQDEARFGQKGRTCRRWFTRGQRPSGLCDQRYTWMHLFAAACPATGQRFVLVLPGVSTAAMQAFLDRFSQGLDVDERAMLVLDQAG